MQKAIRILSLTANLLVLANYLLLSISAYTILTTFMGLTPTDGREQMNAEINPSGDAVFSLKMKNNGLLEDTINASIKIAFKDEVIERGNYITLQPNGMDELRFEFNLTQEQIVRATSNPPKVLMTLEVKTLKGLAGIGLETEVGGITSNENV